MGVAAAKLDGCGGAIELADGTRIDADGVVIATGSRARRWPGCEDMAGVHVIRTIADAVALREDPCRALNWWSSVPDSSGPK